MHNCCTLFDLSVCDFLDNKMDDKIIYIFLYFVI